MTLRDALEDFDHALSQWEQAYPTDVFGDDLTKDEAKQIVAALRAAGFTSERVHASWARHVVRCLAESFAPVRALAEFGAPVCENCGLHLAPGETHVAHEVGCIEGPSAA